MKTRFKILVVVLLMLGPIAGFTQKAVLLEELNADIQNGLYPGLHSILVSKSGQLVLERYFGGHQSDSMHDSRSSFKSVANLLVGIAIDKGFVKSVKQPIHEFFPGHPAFRADPAKLKISIKDLLEMRSGLDCDEWNDEGRDCESEMEKSQDWVDFALRIPMKTEPGKTWSYSSCNTMLLSGILSKATSMKVSAFADKYLFAPLQISRYRWTRDPSGQEMTAGSFYISPGDMLKLGQLMLRKGKWKGKQIVSASWIRLSTKGGIPIPGQASFMKTSRSAIGIPGQTYYGYSWYNELIQTKDWKYNTLIASGNGGQYIMVIKELDLVVVFTQGNYNSWKAKQAFDILAKYLIPAFS